MKHKYPRTPHLPFSPGATSDDKILRSLAHFENVEVVVTEKMDGENTSLYSFGFHARSLDSRHHESRDWLAAFHGRVAHEIPDGWRICGENLYAQHSLPYDALPSYFMGFSVWDETNTALAWDDTIEFFELLGITPVRELYRGPFDLKALKALADSLDLSKQEGFVMRRTAAIAYRDFPTSFAKYVRKGHVQTEEHWMLQAIIPNKLATTAA